MTRTLYGGSPADVVVQVTSDDGDYAPATASFTAWDSMVAGAQLTDLQTGDGTAITAVIPDGAGRVLFLGPDGYTASIWLEDTTGTRWRIDPADLASRTGSGVTDGDKGDITVSSSGTVWSIDTGAVGSDEIADGSVGTAELADDAVTLAKLAEMTSGRLLGRTTSGTGNPEELTPAQARAMLASGGYSHVIWNSTTRTWPARTAGAARVTFSSTDDPTATAPSDASLAVGDVWDYVEA